MYLHIKTKQLSLGNNFNSSINISSSSSYPIYSPLSSTEGWTCLTSLLLRRPFHSNINSAVIRQGAHLKSGVSAVSMPSFFRPTTLHPMISLACLIFSVQLRVACILTQIQPLSIPSCWSGSPHLYHGVQALREASLSLLHHLP